MAVLPTYYRISPGVLGYHFDTWQILPLAQICHIRNKCLHAEFTRSGYNLQDDVSVVDVSIIFHGNLDILDARRPTRSEPGADATLTGAKVGSLFPSRIGAFPI